MQATIIGGGITGLTVAALMERLGLPYALYEAAPELQPVGAGLILSPNALYVLDQLGLYKALAEASHPLRTFDIADAGGRVLQRGITAGRLHERRYHSLAIHRAELQRILLTAIPTAKIHLGRTLTELDLQSRRLRFSPGERLDADYVLACDGIHSRVRRALFPRARLRYAGQSCWRGLVILNLPANRLYKPAELWGCGLRFGYVPLRRGQVYWYATAVQPADQRCQTPAISQHRLLTLFAAFAPFVSEIIGATRPEAIIQHDLYELVTLPSWSRGPFLLLGDAAHAMTPNLGQGAAQGIEDAWSIGHLLAQKEGLEEAFAALGAARQAKANYVRKLSWQIGRITNMRSRLLCRCRNTLFRLTPTALTDRSRAQIFDVPAYTTAT